MFEVFVLSLKMPNTVLGQVAETEVDLTCGFLSLMGFIGVVGFDAGEDEFLGAFRFLTGWIEVLEGLLKWGCQVEWDQGLVYG